MKILVTGGSGVVGRSAITHLLKRGHSVRLLSRGAAEDVKGWPAGVEAWPGDVGSPASVAGAAADCQAVLHLVAIVDESPPEATFERINVGGTRAMLEEAERAGCRRFVFVSSLGADTGTSPYHQSKRAAEQLVQLFSREWVIVRPGAVYGPGDEHLSVMLRMVRTLPVIPAIGDGNQRFQPIWHDDLAEALAVVVDQPDIAGRVLDVAGREIITQRALIDRMQSLTGRHPPVVPVPEALASFGVRAMNAAGFSSPVSESQLAMLREENIIPAGRPNALAQDLGIAATPLDEGLRRFMKEQEVQLPDEGVGTLHEKRFTVEVVPSTWSADRLFDYLREHLLDLMPSLVEPDPERNNPSRVVAGDTLTLAIPIRGHIQVRVAEASQRRITLLTASGHPLAGMVQFICAPAEGGVRFEVRVYDRPANAIDWILMRPIGDRLQESTWTELATSVAQVAGAIEPQVTQTQRALDPDDAEKVERWVRDLWTSNQRRNAAADISGEPPAII